MGLGLLAGSLALEALGQVNVLIIDLRESAVPRARPIILWAGAATWSPRGR